MNAEPPVKGMKHLPYGWDDPLLCEAFMSCVSWAGTNDDIIEAFTEHTKVNLRALIARSPIERMIDDATGIRRDIFLKFCDFVAEFVWGLNEEVA